MGNIDGIALGEFFPLRHASKHTGIKRSLASWTRDMNQGLRTIVIGSSRMTCAAWIVEYLKSRTEQRDKARKTA